MTEQGPPEAFKRQQDYLQSKKEFEEAFKDFHKEVFTSKVLDKNKTSAVKNTEKQMVDRLVSSAVALDAANFGEGTLALVTVALRELLTSRDRNNELDYELLKTKRDLKNLMNELGMTDGKKKS